MLKQYKTFVAASGREKHHFTFLRSRFLRIIVASILFLELVAFTVPLFPLAGLMSSNFLTAVLPAVLSNLTNSTRVEKNVASLAMSSHFSETPLLRGVPQKASQSYDLILCQSASFPVRNLITRPTKI